MKIVMCIAGQKIAPEISATLKQKNFRVTQLASEGGAMKRGNATYLIGVEDDNVTHLMNVINKIAAKYERSSSAHRALAIVFSAEAGAAYVRE